MIASIFHQVFRISFSGIYCILVALAARLLLNRFSKKFGFALWIVVFLTFCIPFSYGAPVPFLSEDAILTLEHSTIHDALTFSNETEYSAQPDTEKAAKDTSTQYQANSFLDRFFIYIPYLWISGVLVLLSCSIFSYVRLRSQLRTARQIGMHIKSSNAINNVIVFGFLHSYFYIPDRITGQERECVLLHEEYHIKRQEGKQPS